MASLTTYVLRLWAEGDAAPGEDPIQLLRREEAGSLKLVASHAQGVSAAAKLSHEGKEIDLTALLEQDHLRRTDLMAAAGTELYRRLAPGEVGEELKKIGRGSRVMLDLRSPALTDLPWELLRRDGTYLFQLETHPWLLGSPDPPPANPLYPPQVDLERPPLRVLLVVGNHPKDDKVKGDDELRGVEDCLYSRRGEVLLRVLDRPDPEEIRKMLAEFEPHVFHFIGHGSVVKTPGADAKPVIRVFSRRSGKNEVWDADRISGALNEIPGPRLVILNACDTAGDGLEQTWQLTDAFFARGVGALLAMQAEILGDAALEFGKRLYRGLAEGLPVDSALARARQQIATTLSADDARANWPVPRLWVRGDPEEVVHLATVDGRCSVDADDDFVHRWAQRSAACRVLCPLAEHGRRLVVLEGPAQSGKTALLKILGETWAHGGGHALYVDLEGPRTSDLRRLVERIRVEVEEHQHGLDPAALQALDLERPSDLLGADLRQALETVAAGPGDHDPDEAPAPLLLLLDGLEDWLPDVVRDTVLPEVCFPYALAEPHSRVWLAIALRDEMADEVAWKTLDEKNQPIRVDAFRPEEWRRAAAQFIRLHLARVEDEDRRKIFADSAWNAARLDPPDRLKEPAMPSYRPDLLQAIRIISSYWSRP